MTNTEIYKINDELNVKLNNVILYLKEHSTLNKNGMMPYIEVKKERKKKFDPWLDESYSSFIKTDKKNVYYCIPPRQADIMLYTDIITENPKKIKNAKIMIGDLVYCSTNQYIRMLDDNTHRLCWNIDNMDSTIKYDKNALWIPAIGLQFREIKIMIEYFGDINELSLKVIGLCVWKERARLAGGAIKPRIVHDKDKEYVNIDIFKSGMFGSAFFYYDYPF
jgi:hypothetical protein